MTGSIPRDRGVRSLARRVRVFLLSGAVIGFASLLWFLIRSGPRPSRAAYPCQRMAAANATAWLGAAVLPLVTVRVKALFVMIEKNWRKALFVTAILGGAVIVAASAKTLPWSTAFSRTHSVDIVLRDHAAGPAGFSDIVAVNGTTGADDGVARLIRAMGDGFYKRAPGSPGVVGTDDLVLIKVNAQWDKRGGTNTDLVRSLILEIIEHPDGFTGEIVIADNGQAQFGSRGRGGSMDWRSNNAIDQGQSMTDVARELSDLVPVSTYLWDEITLESVSEFSDGDDRDGYVVADSPSAATGIIVSYPKFTTSFGTRVSFKHGVWDGAARSYDSDRLTVINVPVLKSHMIYGVTASVKHYMGVVSDKLTGHNAHRSVGSGGMGTQMALTRVPDLNIIDAIWINARPGNGPSTNYSVAAEAGIIAASRDPVALDLWAARNILLPAAAALGFDRTSSMDPANRENGSFAAWMELSARELNRAGYAVTTDTSQVNVRVD